jgi:hypothetical protein
MHLAFRQVGRDRVEPAALHPDIDFEDVFTNSHYEAIAWLAAPGSSGISGQVIRVCGQSVVGA